MSISLTLSLAISISLALALTISLSRLYFDSAIPRAISNYFAIVSLFRYRSLFRYLLIISISSARSQAEIHFLTLS
ncbi:MAG: hypothetical protein LBT73_01460, partial [Tannerellaceae bacterium]|nr:hypothetical protein [Tannerellaceae bacterium]